MLAGLCLRHPRPVRELRNAVPSGSDTLKEKNSAGDSSYTEQVVRMLNQQGREHSSKGLWARTTFNLLTS